MKNKKCNWNLICWHKSNPVPACGNKYLSDTEFVLFFREKGVKVFGNYETKRTYYVTTTNKTDKYKFKHPTIKPLEIVQNFILNSSEQGNVVLDPFVGSGTTAVASINTNRRFIGFEIGPIYFETACKRITDAKNSILSGKEG